MLLKSCRGFTLLEILVAMSIFTLIGLASTGLLTSVIDSNELSETRFAKLQQLQRAMIAIERDILQAVPRAARLNGEHTEIVMRGGELDGSDADAIGFVRSGWNNPRLMLPRSTLQYVGYRLRDHQLERVYSNYVDNVVGYEPKSRVLLSNVTDFKVEFIADANSSQNNDEELDWRETYTGATLPKAVAFILETEDFGQIRREFTLGGNGL